MSTPSQVEAIFFIALEKPTAPERQSYLDEACRHDPELRRQVERLLVAHPRVGSFLEQPAGPQVAGTQAIEHSSLAEAAPHQRAPDQPTETQAEPARSLPNQGLAFLAPSDKPGSLGRLAHYEAQQLLGQGGFGTVLRAFDEKLHRVVAIKVLAPELAASGPARSRFLREARAAAAVRHQHVVDIHAVDELPLPYLVMEYVAGKTLQDKIDQTGPLEVKEILRIGHQIARGLTAAHAQGLIHRDIKPANILLENGIEHVKLTDFGLARAADDASITQSGVVAGTPMYMSPEQAEGLTLDHRSDLFSLGTVLYVMCTGRPPFRATGTMGVLKRVCEDTPRPIREINTEIPQWLCDLIEKLHAKKPADRYASAQEVADLLAKYLSEIQLHGGVLASPLASPPASGKPAPSASPARKWRRALVAAAVLGIGLVAGAFLLLPGLGRYLSNQTALSLQTNSDDIKLIVLKDGQRVAVLSNSESIQLVPGMYGFEIQAPGSMKIQGCTGSEYAWTGAWIGNLDLTPQVFEPIGLDGPAPLLPRLKGHNMVLARGRQVEFGVNGFLDAKDSPGLPPGTTIDLAGEWHDTPEWSDIHLKPKADGYEGTYSATFNLEPGYLNITRTGPATFTGDWGESDRKYHGVFTIHAALDGSLKVSWESRDDRPGGTRKGVSTWRRAQGPPGLAVAPFTAYQAQTYQHYWAQYLGTDVEGSNSLGMKLRLIPPGQFLMGSPPFSPAEQPLREMMISHHGARDEFQHEVEISRPFYLGAHAVTVGQFRAFVKERAYKTEAERIGNAQRYGPGGVTEADPQTNWQNPGYAQTDDHPVTCVSWNDARAFCDWLSEKEGKRYALPTEAQWEYACRAGTHTRFYFGDDDKALGDYAWYALNAQFKAHPVGLKKSNAWGLHDMVGNVWQWTADHYQDGYYQKSPRNDPPGAEADAAERRVLFRGGSWVDGWLPAAQSGGSWLFRSAHRQLTGEQLRSNNIGFRVALVVDATSKSPAWVKLFNGTNLDAWTKEGGQWSVKDSILTGTNTCTLSSTRHYQDFHLRAKMRIGNPGATISFRADAGCHGQLGLGFARETVTLGLHRQGRNSPYHAGKTGAMPKGAWCDVDLIVRGQRAIVKINDELASETVFEGLPASGQIKFNALLTNGALEFKTVEIKELPPASPFVLLAKDERAETWHASLADAVKAAQSGDTIEIRGDGPFVSEPIEMIKKPLTIRAASGYRPHLRYASEAGDGHFLSVVAGALALEGLTLEVSGKFNRGKSVVYSDWGPVYIAHCRVLATNEIAINVHNAHAWVQNCEVRGGLMGVSLQHARKGCLIDNSLITSDGYTLALAQFVTDMADLPLVLSNNTILGRKRLVSYASYLPAQKLPAERPERKTPALRLQASGNVLDSRLNAFHHYPYDETLNLEQAAALLPRLIAFRDADNLYSIKGDFLQVTREQSPQILKFKTLAEWHEFWGIAQSTSLVGQPVYQGGDVLTRALDTPALVTPADFRLADGSPGKGAGKDGKDLGADVNRVGPGQAYELWKQTPEYGEWRKKTAE